MGYRNSLTPGTRAKGSSAVAKHKYQTRQGLYLVGKEGVRDDLVAKGSGNLPAFAEGSADKFWLAVDSYERSNARLYVELQLNLPAELTLEQQKAAVQNYMESLCEAEKLSYSWVIHDGKGQNPHAHVMIQEAKNDHIDRPAERHFMRFNRRFPERGGTQKSATLKPKQWLMDARAGWAVAANDALEAAGFERHFDHRTLVEQRISALLAKDWRKAAELDREVGQHEGWRVAALRRKYEAGKLDVLPEYARKVIEKNDRIKELNRQHLQMVDCMSDQELERWEREAYFQALAEREPERLDAELEQLHSEALELDAIFELHSKALKLDAIFELHSEALELDAVFELHSEALKLDAVFEQHSEALELNALHDMHSEALKIDALYESRNKLKAHDVVLSQLTKKLQKANRFALEQAEKLSALENEYRKLHAHEKKIEAQAAKEEPAALLSLIAKGVRYQTKSDKLREAASQLAQQRLQLKKILRKAKIQAKSAHAEAGQAKQDLVDGKAHRAALADDVLLASGSDTLKKTVAREVQKLERLESDFEKLGSDKALELQRQREAITAAPQPTDAQLLQQHKDLRQLAQEAKRDYRDERLEVAQQARKSAEAAYHQALETLKDCGFDDDYKDSVKEQLDADRSHFFKLLKDPAKRSDPELFKELESDTQALSNMVREHVAEREQLEQQRQLEQQKREAQPRQRQDHKSDFGL